jgi:hypothetical protein
MQEGDPAAKPIKVLYIGALGRSGSTLLDRMLGQIPGFFSGGEIRDLWQRGLQENRLCGCGTPFRECPFWTRVGQHAFGGWDRVDPPSVLALARSVDRRRYMPALMGLGGQRGYERRVRTYGEILSRLYRAIHEESGDDVVVDSSKDPSTVFILRRMADVDLRVIHLVRDPRGVAYSWTKLVIRPDVVDGTAYMHRLGPSRSGIRWLTRSLLFEYLERRGVPVLAMRYETLVRSPREEMERLLRWYRAPFADEDLAYITPGSVVLRVNHTVMGNPVRMHQGPLELRLDDEWRTSMDRLPRGVVTGLTLPLLGRYGYRTNGSFAGEDGPEHQR